MSDTRYNGWTNYETWRVNLELCDDIVSGPIGEQTFPSVQALADYLEETVDEILTGYGDNIPEITLSYARAFVNDVDWYEIAESNQELIAPGAEEEANEE